MSSFVSRIFPGATAIALLGFVAAGSARANVTFDTTPSWDGSSSIQSWGYNPTFDPNGPTPTYGETFIAPTGSTVLNNFTFYIQSIDGNFNPVAGDQYAAQGEVFNWTGSLLGGNPNQGTVGSALYTSPVFTFTSDGLFDAVTVTIPGGLALTAGNAYVIDLTDVAGPSNGDTGSWGDAEFGHVANDGGGGFAFSNVGQAGIWDDGGDFGDLAFTANFSSSGAVPDGANAAILFVLALTALGLVPSRRFARVAR